MDKRDNPEFFCKVTIDKDFHSALENIYSATSITLHDFETLLASYFPEPVCQTLKFNIPTSSQKYTKLYSLYPRLLAKFLAQHLKVKYTCLILENNATSDPLPVVFKSRLDLFHRLFSSLPKPSSTRVKRGTFSRFVEYVWGEADSRMHNLEYYTREELEMVNFLLDKSNHTDLVIKNDEQILSNLDKNVKLDHLRLEDLTIKLDLQRLSRNFHTQFQLSITRLQNFHTINQNILIEFALSFQRDSSQLSKCVRGQSFCFLQHSNLHCTKDCFLTSKTDFFLNFELLTYTRLEVFHASCLHTLSGKLSILDNGMFTKNKTHYTSLKKNVEVPLFCSEQTTANNANCKEYFMETSKDHILQCRNSEVWASGNLSFTNPKLEIKHLSYVPKNILAQDFPIKIKDRQIFADCETPWEVSNAGLNR